MLKSQIPDVSSMAWARREVKTPQVIPVFSKTTDNNLYNQCCLRSLMKADAVPDLQNFPYELSQMPQTLSISF